MEDLIAHYKTESGSLPCKLFYAATKETQFCSTKESRPSDIFNKCDTKLRSKFRAKRRKENNDCQRRLEQARERFIKSQERLRQLLKEKDDRKKELIETLAKQKVKHRTLLS